MFEFLHTKTGIIIMSVVWGLGLSCLFRQVCKGRNCIVIKAPNPKEIEGSIYKYDNKCYHTCKYSLQSLLD
jgi:hypothetical protein